MLCSRRKGRPGMPWDTDGRGPCENLKTEISLKYLDDGMRLPYRPRPFELACIDTPRQNIRVVQNKINEFYIILDHFSPPHFIFVNKINMCININFNV